MEQDSLKHYMASRQALVDEQQALEKRLAEISAALGGGADAQAQAPPRRAVGRPRKKKAPAARKKGKARPGRKKGQKSLRVVLAGILDKTPRSKEEILEKVIETGYKFSTSTPLNSLYTTLTANKKEFKNVDGKFRKA